MDAQERAVARETATPEHYRRILVGTDGSKCSARAAAHAVYLARGLGARLYVAYSVNMEMAFHLGTHFGEAVEGLERSGEEILTAGRPHRALVQISEQIEVDLVVVGSTGMTSLERALIGSEAETLVRLSKRPVHDT